MGLPLRERLRAWSPWHLRREIAKGQIEIHQLVGDLHVAYGLQPSTLRSETRRAGHIAQFHIGWLSFHGMRAVPEQPMRGLDMLIHDDREDD